LENIGLFGEREGRGGNRASKITNPNSKKNIIDI
jgi:hypothetical protein